MNEDKTYQMIDKMFSTMSESLRSRHIHVGMDEAASFGTGAYYKKHGAFDKMELFCKHLNRVSEIARKYSYTMEVYGDMFFKVLNDGFYLDLKEAVVPEGLQKKYLIMFPTHIGHMIWSLMKNMIMPWECIKRFVIESLSWVVSTAGKVLPVIWFQPISIQLMQ